jgi:hypothetical protein
MQEVAVSCMQKREVPKGQVVEYESDMYSKHAEPYLTQEKA